MEETASKWDLKGWTAISGDERNIPGGRNHFRKAGGQGAGEREGRGGFPRNTATAGVPQPESQAKDWGLCGTVSSWTVHTTVG